MKVVFDEINFNVYEKKKTVACVMTGHLDIRSSQDQVCVECTEWIDLEKELRVVGVAKCHSDDTFDPEVGKRIAESRAKRMLYSEGKTKLKKLAKNVKIFLSEIEKGISNLETYKNAESSHIKRLSGEDEK